MVTIFTLVELLKKSVPEELCGTCVAIIYNGLTSKNNNYYVVLIAFYSTDIFFVRMAPTPKKVYPD